jgi:hypothetical protein
MIQRQFQRRNVWIFAVFIAIGLMLIYIHPMFMYRNPLVGQWGGIRTSLRFSADGTFMLSQHTFSGGIEQSGHYSIVDSAHLQIEITQTTGPEIFSGLVKYAISGDTLALKSRSEQHGHVFQRAPDTSP